MQLSHKLIFCNKIASFNPNATANDEWNITGYSSNKYLLNTNYKNITIDDFKKYNDRYSHPEGDKVLKRVISIVLASIDKSKQLVFRYGGEEFVILLPKSSKQEVVDLANKIHDSVVAANISRDDGALYPYVTITLGCDLTNVGKEFIRKVDEQLYIGKRNNKNCVVFNGEIVSK